MNTWHITIDQFGYLKDGEKVAVIACPEEGFNKSDKFTPGEIYQVRRVSDCNVVYEGKPTLWNDGKTDPLSGDKAWWFDFTPVTEPGKYYVYDAVNQVKSYDFAIADDVYERILYHALRMLYYQREAHPHEAPYAEYPWFDKAAWIGSKQDLEARDVFAPDDPSRYKDVSGGWMDAGDTNKYIVFIDNGLHELLATYESNPKFFKNFNLNIPESHLDAPDILSEIKWELDWFMKMQNQDGSAHVKCGVKRGDNFIATSLETRNNYVRYYNGIKSSAAAISIAGVFAHAAAVYNTIEIYKDYAKELYRRAENSWAWYIQQLNNGTRNEKIDNGEIMSGLANRTLVDQDISAVTAAIYLYMLTGKDEYHDYVKANYKSIPPFAEDKIFGHRTGFFKEATQLGTAYLDYMKHPKADQSVVNDLRDIYINLATSDDLKIPYNPAPEQNAYRAYIAEDVFHWGHLRTRSYAAYDAYLLSELNLIPEMSRVFKNRAADHLHHIHGVNPFAMTFLTNMYPAGASKSVSYMYHEWFMNIPGVGMSSPPGYLVGGPNSKWTRERPPMYSPPLGQPPMKCYLDAPHWYGRNENDPEGYVSYPYTEPMCGYQTSYIRLLACFVGKESV